MALDSDTVTANTLDGKLLKRMLSGGMANLTYNCDYLNELNVFPVSDSDTGTNMKNTVERGIQALSDDDSFHKVMSAFAKGMLAGSRGNSGLILSQYFCGIAEHTEGRGHVTVEELCSALQQAQRHAYKAVLHPVEGTMLTVMRDGIQAALPYVDAKTSMQEFFDVLSAQMLMCTQNTVRQMDLLHEYNIVDSGALGLLLMVDGMNRVLQGRTDYFDCEHSDVLPKRATGVEKSITFFRYCTEFAVRLKDPRGTLPADDYLISKGDSIVLGNDKGVLKVHIHTNQPKKLMDEYSWYGEIVSRKIDDLYVTNEFARLHKRKHDGYAVVVFTDGDGNAKLFEQMGADAAFSVPSGYSADEDELKTLLAPFLLDYLVVFPSDDAMRERLNRIRWYSDLKNVSVAETVGLTSTFYALSSLTFIEEYGYVVESLKQLQKHEMYQACVNVSAKGPAFQYEVKAGNRNPKVMDSLTEVLDSVAGELEKCHYSAVVVFGGALTRAEDTTAIDAQFTKKCDVGYTYVDGGQQACQYVIGAY